MSLQPVERGRGNTETPEAADGFLSRWSRRKLGQEHEDAPARILPVEPVDAELAPMATPEPDPEPIDARTGKPMAELTDEDMPEIDTLDADSDLRCFMAGKVSQALRMKALTKVFHSPKYNQVCLCAEYADDYTNFLPMGDIVPHDLKQAIAREAGKLVQRLAERGVEMTTEDAELRMAREFRGEKLEPLPVDIAENDVIETQHPPTQQADGNASSVQAETT